MKIRITVNTYNAAFSDYPGELRRILDRAARETEINEGDAFDAPLFDSNGNEVGAIVATDGATKARR